MSTSILGKKSRINQDNDDGGIGVFVVVVVGFVFVLFLSSLRGWFGVSERTSLSMTMSYDILGKLLKLLNELCAV